MPGSAERGMLAPARPSVEGVSFTAMNQMLARVQSLPLPPGHIGEWAHTYDYAFTSDGSVDIASDGAWHSIALTSRNGAATAGWFSSPWCLPRSTTGRRWSIVVASTGLPTRAPK